MNAFVRIFAWSLLVVRLAYFDVLEVLRARSVNDYGSFHAAAVAIRNGLDPYSLEDLNRAARIAGLGNVHPYFYPPLLAELLLPATWLGAFQARMEWMALTIVSFIVSIALLQRWLERRCEPAGVVFLVATCALWPLRSTQMMAQVNAMVLLGIVLWWVRRDVSPWAGAFLGLAAAVKMSPALLVVVPLVERRWREALVASGTAALGVAGSCAVLGARGMRFFGDVALGFLPGHRYLGLDVPIDYMGNDSIAALAFWIFDQGPAADHLHLSPAASLFQVAAVLALLAGIVLALRRGATAEGCTAALVLVMIVAPTYAFEHHLAFVVLPLALVSLLVAEGSLRKAWLWVLAPSLALLTEHEASFVPPSWAPPARVALHGKLLPILAVYGVALAARHAGPPEGYGKRPLTSLR